jgi:hypothetical protein
MLNGWLHHIAWEWKLGQEYSELPDTEYLLEVPTVEEVKQCLSDQLERTFTPQQWLQAYFACEARVEEQHWERPTGQCLRKHYVSLACCPLHTALNATFYLFRQWLEHFDTLYHMSEMADEHGHTSGLLSANGVALLIHLAKLDTNSIPFTEWFQGVPFVDIRKFHRIKGFDAEEH